MNRASTALQGAENVSGKLAALAQRLEGDLQLDDLSRTIYATDASEYQERPLAVALPKTAADVRELVQFAAAERIGLIPRAAGTSLAGQVVGNGIVVDAGRYLNQIVSLDVAGGCVCSRAWCATPSIRSSRRIASSLAPKPRLPRGP